MAGSSIVVDKWIECACGVECRFFYDSSLGNKIFFWHNGYGANVDSVLGFKTTHWDLYTARLVLYQICERMREAEASVCLKFWLDAYDEMTKTHQEEIERRDKAAAKKGLGSLPF